MPVKYTNRTIPAIRFVNCGHGRHRRINDCKRLNFISAGQGNDEGRQPYFFSNQLRRLIPGDIICVYRNEIGYVGIARVVSLPMTIKEVFLGGVKVTNDIFSNKADMFDNADDPGFAECLVEIEWLTNVHTSDIPASGACYGHPYFAKPLVECSLNQQQFTIDALEKAFNLDFNRLLNSTNSHKHSDTASTEEDGSEITPQEEDDLRAFPEGKEIYLLHHQLERNRGLVKLAKQRYLDQEPTMPCQICGFSFMEAYGEIGYGFIEAHHIMPLSSISGETKTKISDLVFVCSNCHRMLHRKRPWLSLNELQNLLKVNN